MTRILLRATKDPFDVVDVERTLERNLIGGNSGNLVFVEAAHKLLSTPGTTLEPDRFRASARDAARINERYDAYVIPLANAFRPAFETALARLTGVIERLRIPVAVLGVGAQAKLDGDWSRLAPMERTVRAFVAAVLDHGPSIGVRGEVTYDYLRSLGYRDVEVVGCPSMFMWGDDLRVDKRAERLDEGSRIAITISPYVKALGPIVRSHVDRYPNLVYIAQDLPSLRLLVWGEDGASAALDDPIPVHRSHPLYARDRVRFYLDPWPWIEELRERDFAFGTRIHGAIAALLAGTPAVVLAHDSRTLELARYFAIPHRRMPDVGPHLDAAELYATADYTALNAGHAARFATFTRYLARHGLDHVFAHPGAPEAWDARMRATPFPGPVRAGLPTAGARDLAAQLRYLRFRSREAVTSSRRLRGARAAVVRATRARRAAGASSPRAAGDDLEA